MCKKKEQSHELININFGGQDAINSNPINTNRVTTSRYTIFTWGPLSLAYQFKRAANVYFLIISILTSMDFSPKQPASMIGTFSAVLIFTMFKEAFEDYFRHKQDNQLNNEKALVYNYEQKQFVDKEWKLVKQGDFVKITKDQNDVPADILVMKSSSEKGVVFVETMNLDGETNLKEKYVPKDIMKYDEQDVMGLKGSVETDQPNDSLDSWNGNVTLEGQDTFNCGLKNILLRGCLVKNIDYCIGIVIYNGPKSKIMMNAKNPPYKVSNVFKLMNYILYSVFGFQLILIILYATLSIIWQSGNSEAHYYLDMDPRIDAGTWFIQLLTYWVAYSHLIPISLYVGLEVLKLGLSMQINGDNGLFDHESQQFAKVRNSDLIEELGQVSFIFSDKTGTLTCNKMEFKQCSIRGKIYGTYSLPHMKITGDDECCELEEVKEMIKNDNNEDIIALKQFFRLMAICHSVAPETIDGVIKYQASSPDEKSLVESSQRMGIEYYEKSTDGIIIRYPDGKTEQFVHQLEIPFDSDRKRQSVILTKDNQTWIHTKGADNIMIPLLDSGSFDKDLLNDHLDRFSKKGLRTLVMSEKQLDNDFFTEWMKEYEKATTINDEKQKNIELDRLYSQVEQGLTYLGASAIEDKLQDRVPETIKTIMSANIKIWVLTGDKQGTAIEIGKSCNLIGGDIQEYILSEDEQNTFEQNLERVISERKDGQRFGLVIDGMTLTKVLKDDVLKDRFFQLGEQANSVICCRVSPLQKSDVVKLAKNKKKYICLAIGDGANDVSMILEAHIGVGIRGKEGTQAVRSADYAISQFQFLSKLLLFHGRLGYKRISYFICYYFYKNILLVLTELYFAFFNGFSGQIFFADWLSMMYNAIWTSWPCLFFFGLDIDANAMNSLKFPELYGAGHVNYYFNLQTFWKWMLLGFYQGALSFFVPMYGLTQSIDETARTQEFWFISCVSFSVIIHIVTYKLFIETSSWNFTSGAITIMSMYVYYWCVIVMSSKSIAFLFQPQINETFYSILWMWKVLFQQKTWFILLVLPLVGILPDLLWNMVKRLYYPSPAELIMKKQEGNEKSKHQ